ncbi:MAG: alpha/beta hydrolase [Sphingomonadaceae bacterium]|nr:alpha/beta hydrolase [Sphingomonadaceae bacterium]
MTHPHYVRPDVQAFVDFLAAQPGPRTYELDPPAARQLMKMMTVLAELPTGDIAVRRDIAIPGPAGDIPARLYDARDSREPGPAMVFYHGGGFVLGDLDTHEPVCAEIARTLDMPVISVDYRLAPEAPWPAAPDDCEAAARWVATSPEALGRKVTSLVLAGDSAGGNLCVITTLALRDEPAQVPVAAQWPIYPAVDGRGEYGSGADFGEGFLLDARSMKWFVDHYGGDQESWRLNPLFADHAGTPPTLVFTAGLDPLRDQGRAYAAELIRAGVPTIYREAAGNIHGLINLRKIIPSSQGDVAGCLAALKAMVVEAEANRVMAQAAGATSGISAAAQDAGIATDAVELA